MSGAGGIPQGRCRGRTSLAGGAAPLGSPTALPRWATGPELGRPPRSGRRGPLVLARVSVGRARVMRPAGCLFAPMGHPGPHGSGIVPSARRPPPPAVRGGARPPRKVSLRGREGGEKGLACWRRPPARAAAAGPALCLVPRSECPAAAPVGSGPVAAGPRRRRPSPGRPSSMNPAYYFTCALCRKSLILQVFLLGKPTEIWYSIACPTGNQWGREWSVTTRPPAAYGTSLYEVHPMATVAPSAAPRQEIFPPARHLQTPRVHQFE